jgi:hypothetical protein
MCPFEAIPPRPITATFIVMFPPGFLFAIVKDERFPAIPILLL